MRVQPLPSPPCDSICRSRVEVFALTFQTPAMTAPSGRVAADAGAGGRVAAATRPRPAIRHDLILVMVSPLRRAPGVATRGPGGAAWAAERRVGLLLRGERELDGPVLAVVDQGAADQQRLAGGGLAGVPAVDLEHAPGRVVLAHEHDPAAAGAVEPGQAADRGVGQVGDHPVDDRALAAGLLDGDVVLHVAGVGGAAPLALHRGGPGRGRGGAGERDPGRDDGAGEELSHGFSSRSESGDHRVRGAPAARRATATWPPSVSLRPRRGGGPRLSCSAGRRAGTAAPRTKAFANTGSAELTAMVERVAPSISALLADGVPHTKPATVETLADRHDKQDVVHALIRLAVTGQVEESGGRYLPAATGT